MLTDEIINIIIPAHINRTGTEVAKHISGEFSMASWPQSNYKIVAQINRIVFNPLFLQYGWDRNNGIRSSLWRERELILDDMMIYRGKESSRIDTTRKLWDRFLNNTVGSVNHRKLEFSVILALLVIVRVLASPGDMLNMYVKMYRTLFRELEIEVSDEILGKLTPSNFPKEYKNWMELLNDNLEVDFNRDDYLSILTEIPCKNLSYFDVFVSVFYLSFWYNENHKSILKRVKKTIIDQWYRFIIEQLGSNKDFFRQESDETLASIISSQSENQLLNANSELTDLTIKDSEKYAYSGQVDSNDKFKFQANLYFDIDSKAIVKVMNQLRKNNLVVLDLGCGDGEVTCSRFLGYSSITKIIGVDNKENQIAIAKAKAKALSDNDKCSFLVMDMDKPEFVEMLKERLKELQIDKVDIIFAAMSLHHLNCPKNLIAELKEEVLHEGGYFIVREVNDDAKMFHCDSEEDDKLVRMIMDDYKKIIKTGDRACAKKVYSWFSNLGFEPIEQYYESVDISNKTNVEKQDIYNIMLGFFVSRTKNLLLNNSIDDKTKKIAERILKNNANFYSLYLKPGAWFTFTNTSIIARNPIIRSERFKKSQMRDIEIYLVRHAHCDVQLENGQVIHKLSEKGFTQIKALSEYLKNTVFHQVFSSDLERAIMTAEPIAQNNDVQLKISHELIEIDRGQIKNDDFWKFYPHYYEKWRQHTSDLPFPGGESGIDVWMRVQSVINEIVEYEKQTANESNQLNDVIRACVVCHGGTIRSILAGLIDLPQQHRYQLSESIDNCSISIVRIRGLSNDSVNTTIPLFLECINNTVFLED